MKKSLFVVILISLCIFLLVGCIRHGFQVETEPTASMTTLSPTQMTSMQSEAETAFVTTMATTKSELVSTPTIEPSMTDTPLPSTPTPTMPALLQADTTITPIMCSQFKSYVNIQQETDNVSKRLMDFVFDQENVITFLMWSDRPRHAPTPTPFAGTIEPGEGGPPLGGLPLELSQSRRVLLKGQTWDFNSGTVTESLVTEQDAMQNPCDQDCPLEVIGVAPDNNWQLLQITEAPAEYQGLWLVNEETVYNLVPYVPFFSKWQWSNDSHMLWLIYSLQDINGETYGSESMVVDLTSPTSPQIVFRSWETNPYRLYSPPNLLSPDDYKLVFSPVHKTVLLYENIGDSSLIPPNNLLPVYVFDVSHNPPQLLDMYEARYPFLIDWSDSLQDFIIMELSTTGAVIYTLNNQIVYEIPKETLKSINLNVGRGVTISPAQKNIVLMTSVSAWAYSCSD